MTNTTQPLSDTEQAALLARAKQWFVDDFIQAHLKKVKQLRAKDLQPNPFLEAYLTTFLEDEINANSRAKALVLPRVLGTSVSTIFGTRMQSFTTDVLSQVFGSTTSGIDIEFIDKITSDKVMAQVKLGPNTINKDDVETINQHFLAARRLAKTNNLDTKKIVFAVGVMYGDENALSAHYKALMEKHRYEVFAGQDFWHRLTGSPTFYQSLVQTFTEAAQEVNSQQALKDAIARIAADLRS